MKTPSTILPIAAALALTLGLAPARADQPPRPSSANASQSAPARPQVKQLVFGEGSDVEGGVISPDGDAVDVAGALVHSNLVRVRRDFIPEIFKSAEDL